MQIEEVWALDTGRITAFFEDQQDVTPAGSGFAFRDCRITVTALEPRRMAGMALPQTRVAFDGAETSVMSVYQRFHLRFLSAGG